jgi:quercetin dioxygenase-like cupin family protein
MAAQRDTNVWWFLDTLVVVHRTASGLGPLVLDITLPVGGAPPLHRHDGYDDSEYLLEGQLVVDDGGEWSTAEAGQWLSTRRGVPHRFRVVGDRPARMLGVHQRRSFLRLIYALGEPAQELSLPPPGRGPDGEEVLRTFRAHDVIVLGPSIEEDEALAFVATT